jgi:acyl-CoA synthetase (AMP-forming)/AMP-acid ligase II
LDKVAILGDSEFTHRPVRRRCPYTTAEQFGVQPGDRVALWLKNRPEFVPALFGILNAGAVVRRLTISSSRRGEFHSSGRRLQRHRQRHGPGSSFLALSAARQLKLFKVEEFAAGGTVITKLLSPDTRPNLTWP